MIFFVMLVACLPFPQTDGNVQQDSPTAESVIERSFVSQGGEAAIRNIKNYSIKGRILQKGRVLAEFETHQADQRYLTIDRFQNGTTRRSGINGTTAWRIDTAGKAILLKGTEAQDFIRLNGSMKSPLDWRRNFDTVLYAGEKIIQGVQTHHLIFVAPDNKQVNRYYSIASGFYIREERVIGTGQSRQIMVIERGNFVREASGKVVSLQAINRIGTDAPVEYKIDSYTHNTTDESVFAVPESVKQLIKKSPE